MTVSGILGFLSLLGYLAALGQSFWKTRVMSKNSLNFSDYGFDEMPKVIEHTLRYCLNRGFVVITDKNSERFIQFRKYILRKGEYGLELEFPEVP